ncbi:ubiquinone biosynthesis UbiH/UbiF/VisC/COQ6 family hydroxylase [Variovorax sp. TBS-050B]|uniref:5-demethoxyubiquinol-8 5-hydroxylase UbiM n=1 Tax=Variovorax sp. TBS-050B TaxID=2940551 RepID=UPI002476B867|nr:5-demethoxyubiquinol-8 5-hydroxylase UbiM [Variovorax sp. TBS-050B]MDH6590597.1 ubiquinone biosynthesis UbiH/UbiF/VisC/COQ6 family hydroxylase [Variovorax sp. TBS-050B]
MQQQQPRDVLIVGAGPAGLALAIALSDAGLAVTVVDAQPREGLAAPPEDGRDIALTHASVDTLRALGLWQRLLPGEIGRIREARVIDGDRQDAALRFVAPGWATEALGWIVPNHALRRASFAAAAERAGVQLLTGTQVQRVEVRSSHAELELAPKTAPEAAQRLQGRLLVAADSRFSSTRRQLGIGVDMVDFGRTMIVCRMRHERPHDDIAYECFGYERTLAVLPAVGAESSVVVTTDGASAARLMALPEAEFAALVQRQFRDRFGAMHLSGPRHPYPLVATWARRFAAPRAVLVGDAAVGMHPVTAHGYNLGLRSVELLSQALAEALAQRRDIAQPAVLEGYERAHRRGSAVLYHGTNAVARLYASNGAPQRLARRLLLDGAQRLPPLKAAIVAQLTRAAGGRRAAAGEA